MPAQLARGSIANMTPEHTATERDANCVASTTMPAAAPPVASALGARAHNSVGGKTLNQPCMNR